MLLTLLVSVFVLLEPEPVNAQQDDNKDTTATENNDWDVTVPRGDTRTIDFTVDEGTWMSTDISPNGEWIVFDLMGHIYRMPAEGGQAESLTQNSGLAFNFHPVISPNGEYIAFISDRKGQNNLWIMEADGSNPEAVFTSNSTTASQPVWTPDGKYIIVKRSEGLWMYHRDGGDGILLVSDEEADDPSWPSVSADGRYLYFMVETGGAGEPLSGNFQLRRYNFETGRILALTTGDGSQGAASSRLSSGGAFAPAVSPNGKWLAFARKMPYGSVSYKGHEFGPRTALWIRNLKTGAERKLMDPITTANENWRGVLPLYSWSSDSESIILTQGGKIREVNVESGEIETIPFQARIHREISEQAYSPFRIKDKPFQPKFLRWFAPSPDGSKLAFQAVGQIWVTELPDGEPRRLTQESYGEDEYGLAEFAPAWAPSGKSIVFTTLNAENQGHVWKVAAEGGKPKKLTERASFYTNPEWSPNGEYLVITRGGGAIERGRTVTHNAFFELVKVPAGGGTAEQIAIISKSSGVGPNSYARRAIPGASFGPEGRIYFPDPELVEDNGDTDLVTALISIKPDGTGRKMHMTFPGASAVVPSPDGGHVAFEEGGNIYFTPFPGQWTNSDPVHLDKSDAALPTKQISKRGGLFPVWTDNNTLTYGSANKFYTYNLSSEEKDSTLITFEVSTARAEGTIAIVGGRILTMNPDGQEIIEEGTIVVEDGRIICVGNSGECDAGSADHTVDAAGKTIMPGIIDTHSHHYRENRGHRPPNDYESAIYLAYGITTSLDNSMWSRNIFPTAERIKAGRLIGPRTFSTGDPLYEGDGPNQNEISSYEEALNDVLRLKSWGAVSIKQYSNDRRELRQWIIEATRKAGVMVTGHWRPGIVMDGHTGIEHARGFAPLYEDMTKFYGKANIFYTPTMVVSGPGAESIDYWIASNKIWQDEKQRLWMPWRMLTFTRWRNLRPRTDYSFPLVAESMESIVEAGGWATIGGHGEHHALSPIWEIWMAAEGMGEMGALKAATIYGAHFVGVQQDLGSIEEGKLADLLILNSNPLVDIRNTLDIKYVMKGGVLYEGMTLDEVWPDEQSFGPRYWLNEEATVDDVRPVDSVNNE